MIPDRTPLIDPYHKRISMIYGTGHGKIILFGEHFVVHDLPAIVASLEQSTTATITQTPGKKFQLIDKRPFAPGVKPTTAKQQDYELMAQRIIEYFDLPKDISVTLGGNLMVTNGGIGASAAAAVSIVQALNSNFDLGCTRSQLFDAALHGETAVHTTPSGVDNAAALYKGIFRFTRQKNRAPAISQIKLIKPLHLVAIDTGKPCNIKSVIHDTNVQKAFQRINGAYTELASKAPRALEENDIENLGKLMLENQNLLEQLSISNQLIETIIQQSLQLGACGAKLTGTGRGGLVITLAPNHEIQQRLFSFFTQQKKYCFPVTLHETIVSNYHIQKERNIHEKTNLSQLSISDGKNALRPTTNGC